MFSCRLMRETCCLTSNLHQLKRFAGHSKWHNIRHVKASKDGERALAIARKLRDIKVVLSTNGWVSDPVQSPPLARAIEAAYAANVPKETLENYLTKIQKIKEHPIEYRLRGPNDCIIIVTYSCTAVTESDLRNKMKKLISKASILESTPGFAQAFEKKGVILAKHLASESNMDYAEEAAILGGAEEVRPEEEEGKNVYRFLTEPEALWAVTKYLRKNQWEIREASIEDLPTYLVEVPDSQLKELTTEIEKFQEFPEFLKIVDNIA